MNESGRVRILLFFGLFGLISAVHAQQPTPEVLAKLKDGNEKVRVNVIRNLKIKGTEEQPVIDALTAALADSNTDVRRGAAAHLAIFGERAKDSLKVIVPMLTDSDSSVRASAAVAVGSIAPPDATAIPTLVTMLDDESATVRQSALEALRKHGLAAAGIAPRVLPLLKDDRFKDLHLDIAQIVALMRPVPAEAAPDLILLLPQSSAAKNLATAALDELGDRIIPDLVRALQDKNIYLRRAAAQFIAKLNCKEAWPQIQIALKDEDHAVRQGAIQAAIKIAGENRDAIPALLESMVSDKVPENRVVAARGIVQIEPKDDVIFKALAAARPKESSGGVKKEIDAALAKVMPENAAAVLPMLNELLKDKASDNRAWACSIFEILGPAAKDSLPNLLAAARESIARSSAVKALIKVAAAQPQAVQPLLRGESDDIRGAGIQVFVGIGEPALPAVIEVLRDTNPEPLLAAIAITDQLGPRAVSAAPALIEVLKNKTPKVRTNATYALTKMGEAAAPLLVAALADAVDNRQAITDTLIRNGVSAVPTLIDAIKKSQDAPVVFSSLDALKSIGPKAKAAVGPVLEILNRPLDPAQRPKYCAAVFQTLAAINDNAKVFIPVLFQSLLDKDKAVVAEAARALEKVGSAEQRVPPLSEALLTVDPYTLEQVLRTFGETGYNALAVELESCNPAVRQKAGKILYQQSPASFPALCAALKSEKWEARAAAANTLGQLGLGKAKTLSAFEKILPEIRAAANDDNPDVCILATAALGKFDDKKIEHLPRLAKAVSACSPEVRAKGFAVLSGYDIEKNAAAFSPALPGLLQLFPTSENRSNLKVMLSKIPPQPEHIPVLIASLKGEGAQRVIALKALEDLGEKAGDAVPALIEGLKDEDRPYSRTVASALAAIGPKSVPPLLDSLRTDDSKVRANVLFALTKMKFSAKDHAAALSRAINDESAEVRAAAVQVIGSLGENARDAVPQLVLAISDEDKIVFNHVQDAMAKLGPHAVPAMSEALKSKDVQTRLRVLRLLRGSAFAAAANKDVVGALLVALNDDNMEVKTTAMSSLARYKTCGPDIVPALAELLNQRDSAVRKETLTTLQSFDPICSEKVVPGLILSLRDNNPAVQKLAIDALASYGPAAKGAGPALVEVLRTAEPTLRAAAAKVLEITGAINETPVRIAVNEMRAFTALLQYSEAQNAFYATDGDGDGVAEFAKALPELAGLAGEIRAADGENAKGAAFNGYRFKLLTAQGHDANGGHKSYVVNGNLTIGHALLAYPENYGAAGVNTLMIDREGAVFQRDLGPETPKLIAALTEYNPDKLWRKVRDPQRDDPPDPPPAYFKPKEKNEATNLEF